MIRTAIVGCGKIADQHASQIRRIPHTTIVAVCDREELMAKQMQERFGIKHSFTDLDVLLRAARPDVVHVTTPPHSHFQITKACLEAGSNVYVEKPFTINTGEAKILLDLAVKKELKVTVGHNAQFTPAALRMRELVNDGFLGGDPVHMECYYCYDLGDPRYAKALLGDKDHWARKLPGKLLHNIINHGISKIAEFVKNDFPEVVVHSFTSPMLRGIGESEIVDEARVIIDDRNTTTAYFTFSTQMRPVLHQFRLYGPKNGLIIDDDHQTVIKLRGSNYKSYLEQVIPSFVFAAQYLKNLTINIKLLLTRDLHNDKGMKHLIESFYDSITNNSPVPIPYREILLTSRIMDDIFRQVYPEV